MAQTKFITGNAIVNDNSTIHAAGNVGSRVNQLSVMSDLESLDNYGSQAFQAFHVASSGNLGTHKPLPGGTYNYQGADEFIGQMLTDKIAGIDSTVNDIPASDKGKKKKPWPGYTQEGITDISHFTGQATYNASRGRQIKASGIDGTIGAPADHAANPSMTTPGELVYQKTGKVPTQDTYKTRYST